jgi:molybdate transport system substrate-binding protein
MLMFNTPSNWLYCITRQLSGTPFWKGPGNLMAIHPNRPLLLALAATFFIAASSTRAADPSITVSAAISLREALTQIANDWQKASGVAVQLNFGASGTLMTQIQAGAPVDLFISAGPEQVDQLIQKSLADPATRRNVVGNTLVLIVPADAKQPPAQFADLADARFTHIAIGQPQAVPAGMYAMQVFKSLSIDSRIKDRLVYGANVRQVLDYVQNGDVQAGIVYKTDAITAGTQVRIVATADAAWHEPIVYPGVVLKDSKSAAAALKFLEQLQTPQAAATFRDHGFIAGADLKPTTSPAGRPATAPTGH